ncbi:hypothetical protein Cci01nite_15340 [Catellatospora citrea]|uniref:Uncharacterized protein n=1 Tax=Catellatospora citrea TaxID=53366 RepID=A0A8J3NZL2_9ACTN|nr:hypothetical protein Cci01nite_15340 [Catellatospora citrea]
MVPRDQPNACSSGSMSTPGVARNPAAPTMDTSATAATAQARFWLRVLFTLFSSNVTPTMVPESMHPQPVA